VISPLTALQQQTGNHSQGVLFFCAKGCLEEGTDYYVEGIGKEGGCIERGGVSFK